MTATRTKIREKAEHLLQALSDEMRVRILGQLQDDEQRKRLASQSQVESTEGIQDEHRNDISLTGSAAWEAAESI